MSTLWALLHKGERVKATLKGIPDVVSAVQTCPSTCAFLLQDAENSGACLNKRQLLQQLEQSCMVVSRAMDVPLQVLDS
jgi:hypothetical protein